MKITKSIISIVLAIVVSINTLLATLTVFAYDSIEETTDNTSISVSIKNADKNPKLEKIVNNYTVIKYGSLSNLCYDSSIEELIDSDCDEALILKTIIEHRKIQLVDLRFNNVTIDVNIDEIVFDNDNKLYTLKYTEYVKYMLNIEKNNCYSEEITEHILHINNKYKIIEDEYENDFKEEIENLIDNGLSPIIAKERVISNSKRRVHNMLEERKNSNEFITVPFLSNQTLFQKDLSFTSIATYSSYTRHAYNRNNAESYALKYALTPNPKYMNMEKYGGNCTNFTSQCIYAGGIKADKIGNYQWYYTDSDHRAPAWSSANLFRDYYINNVGSSSVYGLKANKCNFNSTRKGDLIQKVINGKAVHTMFIDGYICDKWGMNDPWKYKYDVFICQNSTSSSSRQKHVPFSSKNIPANQVEYVHIDSCYY